MNNIKWMTKNSVEKLNSPFQTIGKLTGEPKYVIIALHGFGDTAANFATISNEINLNNALWLFIQGPNPVSIGVDGAQWFSLFSNPKIEISKTENLLFEFVEHISQVTGLPSHKIFILGFSQGASMALYYGMNSYQPLGGIISLSGFMVQQNVLVPLIQMQTQFPPIFLAHGTQDQVLFPVFYHEIKNLLSLNANIKLTCKNYKIGHSISQEELSDIKKFIESNQN